MCCEDMRELRQKGGGVPTAFLLVALIQAPAAQPAHSYLRPHQAEDLPLPCQSPVFLAHRDPETPPRDPPAKQRFSTPLCPGL